MFCLLHQLLLLCIKWFFWAVLQCLPDVSMHGIIFCRPLLLILTCSLLCLCLQKMWQTPFFVASLDPAITTLRDASNFSIFFEFVLSLPQRFATMSNLQYH